jgi:hypothetical protein
MAGIYLVTKTNDGRNSWGFNIYENKLNKLVVRYGVDNLFLRVVCDLGEVGEATIDIPYRQLYGEILPKVDWAPGPGGRRLTFEVARGSYEFTWRHGVYWTPKPTQVRFDRGDRSLFVNRDQLDRVFFEKDVGSDASSFTRPKGGRVFVLTDTPGGWGFVGEVPIDDVYEEPAGREEWKHRVRAVSRPTVRYSAPVLLEPLAGQLESLPTGGKPNQFRFPRELPPSDAEKISSMGRGGEANAPWVPPLVDQFRSEFSDAVSYRRASIEVSATYDHGRIVDALAGFFQGPEFGRSNTRPFDLVVSQRSKARQCLFEVKSDSSTTSLYEAVGQLFVYSQMIQGDPLRIAVFPVSMPKSAVALLEKLGIRTLLYTIDDDRSVTFATNPAEMVGDVLAG